VSNSPTGGIELLKKLVEDKPKRQFRRDEMKKAPVLFRLVLLFVMLAGGLALYSVTRGAQTPSLADRVAKLKTEINSVPTKPPAQDDYFYLRVAQIDGEAAWVSPVWIGEQNSVMKSR
jgi:hypothetical protein